MTETTLLNELAERIPEVHRNVSGATRTLHRRPDLKIKRRKQVAEGVWVRAYRPSDEAVVLWLQRNGHLHGVADTDRAAFPGTVANSDLASRHQVLVVEADGQVVGATAIDRRQEPIAHLRWLCIAPDWQAKRPLIERLVETATTTVREHGCLKLIVHTALAASQLTGFFECLGFVFSRERWFGGAHVIEFYLNLYARLDARKQGHKGRAEDPR